MGYNGKIDKSKRTRLNAIDEANKVICVGLEMLEIVEEIKEASKDPILKSLNMRVGIHTG
jgi:class 3 adenylate cyclase